MVENISSQIVGTSSSSEKKDNDKKDDNKKDDKKKDNESKTTTNTNLDVDPDVNSAPYTSLNPFAQAGLRGQCTWFAWGKFYEIYGYDPGFRGNGCTNAEELVAHHRR